MFETISWVFLFGWFVVVVVYCGVLLVWYAEIYISTASLMLVLPLEVFVIVSLLPSSY
jgi:hypothetical protein